MNFKEGGINLYYYQGNDFIKRTSVIRLEYLNKLRDEAPEGLNTKLVLECSTCGDKRFSAFGAKVKAFGAYDFVEFFYRLAKGFEGKERPRIKDPWYKKMDYIRSIKGKKPDFMILGSKRYDVSKLSQWYHMLWIRYLDANPDLVDYLKLFDEYNDVYKGSSVSCKADSIRKYIKDGRESLLVECDELNSTFTNPLK